MGHVVFDKENFFERHTQPLVDNPLHPQLVPEPVDHRLLKNFQGRRISLKHGREDTLKLQEGFFVEDNVVEVRRFNSSLFQAKFDGQLGKTEVVLLPAEALLFRGGDEPAIPQNRRSGVVIETTDSQYMHKIR